MKIRVLAFTVLSVAFIFASCKKDAEKDNNKDNKEDKTEEVVEPTLGDISYVFDYKSLLLEFTSTGCPGCGSWGKPTFYSFADNNSDKVVPMAAHFKYGDPMTSGVAEFFAGNRTGSRYTPQIWVNDATIMVLAGNSINGSASVQRGNDLISGATPTDKVGLGSLLEIQDAKAYIKYGVKLKADFAAGDYWVNSYLMEDGIVAEQKGYASNPATHDYVIRAGANGPWGNMITKKDAEVFEATWEHTFTENIKVGQYLITILWKKEGNIYKPVNVVKVK